MHTFQAAEEVVAAHPWPTEVLNLAARGNAAGGTPVVGHSPREAEWLSAKVKPRAAAADMMNYDR